jgi:glycosyltransferase involved in cell wall biosynthesis
MKYEVPIYISDNCSPDETTSIAEEFRQKYQYIFYNRNVENIGPDRNFEAVLKSSLSRYSWLLSDDDRIIDGGVEKVLVICKASDYDLILLNGGNYTIDADNNINIKGRVKDVPSTVFFDRSKLLGEVGWHMQLISCLVFSSKMIRNANFEEYRKTFLVQFGAIFDYLATREIEVCWLKDPLVYSDSNEPLASWLKNAFEIFAKNWTELILSLPSTYDDHAKLKCIKDHGKKGGLFTVRACVFVRANNVLNLDVVHKYEKYLKYISDVPKFIIVLISLIPIDWCKAFENIYPKLIKIYHKIQGHLR